MSVTRIRPYEASDRAQLYTICLQTGDAGNDASARCTHPELLGDYFAVPYVELDQTLCLMLADDAGPCGYILGTVDTRAFYAWFNRVWLPAIRTKFGNVTPATEAVDAWLLDHIQHDAATPPWAGDFPAHLHIDLLPRAQGLGWGRQLFGAWLDLVAARDAPGVHLGVAKANTRAIAFYERMGMSRLADVRGAWVYGLKLAKHEPGAT